jgi:hypothetical protein
LDSMSQKIGPVMSSWSVAATGRGAGAATVSPTTNSRSTSLTPSARGLVTLSASPVISGLTTAKVDILISGLYLQVGSTFDPASPVDDQPNFVPGADLTGHNLPIPNPANGTVPIQTVTLHFLTPASTSGTVSYALQNVTSYPGIAMNWPVNNPGTGKDFGFAGGSQSTTVAFDSSGDTRTSLYVYDYGAYGELTATITTGNKSYVVRQTIPKTDQYHLGLPDAGWNTVTGHVSANALQSASDDLDASPSGPTQPGDGFSAFEEYRGFVVQGQHERLDPQTRDLFIDADSAIDLSFVIAQLPYRFHYIVSGESKGTDLTRPAGITIARTAPVMDPNRSAAGGTTVPGSQTNGQRGLRLVYNTRLDYPTQLDPNDGTYYPIWQFGIRGNTWQDQMTIQPLDNSQAVPFATLTPNKIRFIEIFARSQSNGTVHMGGGPNQNPQPLYLDDTGQPVPDCSTVSLATPCDRYLSNIGTVVNETLPPGNQTPKRFILHSRLTYPGDYYSKLSYQGCGAPNLVEVSQSDYNFLTGVVVAHETGHYLALDHTPNCSEMMFGIGGFMPDYLPYPANYTAAELAAMRTHQ